MSDIKNKIISIFGGVGVVARICGVTPGAVSQWDLIPARHQNTLLEYAATNKIKASPNDFHEVRDTKRQRP